MPSPVSELNKVNTSISSSDSSESPVTPFSIVDLLGTKKESDVASVKTEAVLENGTDQESSDDTDEPNGANWLAYWSAPLITRPIESWPAQQMTQVEQNMAVAPQANGLTNPLMEQLLPGGVNTPLMQSNATEMGTTVHSSLSDTLFRTQDMMTSFMTDTQPVARQLLDPMSSMTKMQEQGVMSALMQNMKPLLQEEQERTIVQPAIPDAQGILSQAMGTQSMLNDMVIKKNTTIDEVDLKKQSDGSNQLYTLDIEPMKRHAPTFSVDDLLTQSHPAVTADGIEGASLSANQSNLGHNATTTLQILSQNLNDFLTQGIGPVQPEANALSLQSKTPAFDASTQITMELVSLQPEPLADGAGLKLEQYNAQIKVNPQELGQITAKIEVNNGIASITFLTEHAHVKQLMDANLSGLRQAFQQSSLNLNTVDVHHGGSQDKRESPAYLNRDEEDDLGHEKIGKKVIDSYGVKTNRSIIDTYA